MSGCNPHLNVSIVTTAERYGWELIWQNPAEDYDDTWEPGSDSEEPVYGVHVLFDGEHLPLWYRSWDGAILRHETSAERELDLRDGDYDGS